MGLSVVCVEDGVADRAGAGRVKDRAATAQRRAGEPILSRAAKKSARSTRSLRAAKLGAPLVLEAARPGTVRWEV
jgi:hypothetical protein